MRLEKVFLLIAIILVASIPAFSQTAQETIVFDWEKYFDSPGSFVPCEMTILDSTLYIVAYGSSYDVFLLLSFDANTGEFIGAAKDVPIMGYKANLATDGEKIYVECDDTVYIFEKNLTLVRLIRLEAGFDKILPEDFAVVPSYFVICVGIMEAGTGYEAVVFYDENGNLVKICKFDFAGAYRALTVVGDEIIFAAFNRTHVLLAALSQTGEALWNTTFQVDLVDALDFSLAARGTDIFVVVSNSTYLLVTHYTTAGELVTKKVLNVGFYSPMATFDGSYLYVIEKSGESLLIVPANISSANIISTNATIYAITAGDNYAILGGVYQGKYYIGKLYTDGSLAYEAIGVLNEYGFDVLSAGVPFDGKLYLFYNNATLPEYSGLTGWLVVIDDNGTEISRTKLGGWVIDADKSDSAVYALVCNFEESKYTVLVISEEGEDEIDIPSGYGMPLAIASYQNEIYIALEDGSILKYVGKELVWRQIIRFEGQYIYILRMKADETGVYLLGYAYRGEYEKTVLIKLSSDGNEEWSKTFNSNILDIDVGRFLALAGITETSEGSIGYRLLLFSKDGELLLNQTQYFELPLAVAVNDSEVIVASLKFTSITFESVESPGKLVLEVYNASGSKIVSNEKDIDWFPPIITEEYMMNDLGVYGSSIYVTLTVQTLSYDVLVIHATRKPNVVTTTERPMSITMMLTITIGFAAGIIVIYLVIKKLRK